MLRPVRAGALAAAAALIPAFFLLFGAGTAAADPSANDWYRLRMCEASNNYQIDTGNGYYGAYQFNLGTWKSVGGTGYPNEASPAEQDYRALILYRQRGWQPWPACSKKLELVADGDAGTGVIPPVPDGMDEPATGTDSTGSQSGSAPPWPGVTFRSGSSYDELRTWQRRAGDLGYGLIGTGYFGPKTEAAVLAIQRKAGLHAVGYIGPKTWAAAWDATNAASAADSKPTPARKPLRDVTAATPHYRNIIWLRDQGITKPIGGLYQPSQPVNRGSMAAFLFRLTNPGDARPACTGRPFPDVPTDHLFCGYIQWAKKHGITHGYGDGTYRPGDDVSRGAMSAFLYRVANPGSSQTTCTTQPYRDVPTHAQFCGTISWAKAHDITEGTGPGRHYYRAAGNVTRGSMASFLHRIYDYLA